MISMVEISPFFNFKNATFFELMYLLPTSNLIIIQKHFEESGDKVLGDADVEE